MDLPSAICATALAGARNAQQAEENSRALHITISAEDLKLIDGWLTNRFQTQ
ncbi:hypothetical protein [Niabella hibiscisoli]|uniref:hypothetical protein n=1 Tax=Niabella hibiscisoli TaxID=1825928 RepID=UPI001F0E4C3B|nr:hypothetical protein [Niabella hibiscisoli]MCH5715260.1 hypothetical protein [Niabella hibiscisoli]